MGSIHLWFRDDSDWSSSARCYEAARGASDDFQDVSDLVEERLWLAPSQAHVDEKSYEADEGSVEHKMRIEASAHPNCENEGEPGRSNQDRGQKGTLAEEVERGKDDGEDTQLRQKPA